MRRRRVSGGRRGGRSGAGGWLRAAARPREISRCVLARLGGGWPGLGLGGRGTGRGEARKGLPGVVSPPPPPAPCPGPRGGMGHRGWKGQAPLPWQRRQAGGSRPHPLRPKHPPQYPPQKNPNPQTKPFFHSPRTRHAAFLQLRLWYGLCLSKRN